MLERLAVMRSLMALVFLGFLIVGTAMLCMLWPLGSVGDARTTSVNFRARVEEADQASGVSVAQRILDLVVCGGIIVGLIALFIAWIGGRRDVLIALMVVGILSIAYASGMALYSGPLVFICGFMLVLFGGLVAWMSSSSAEPSGEPLEPGKLDETHDHEEVVDSTTNRTNDNASQSVA
jgi:hypothetical protein